MAATMNVFTKTSYQEHLALEGDYTPIAKPDGTDIRDEALVPFITDQNFKIRKRTIDSAGRGFSTAESRNYATVLIIYADRTGRVNVKSFSEDSTPGIGSDNTDTQYHAERKAWKQAQAHIKSVSDSDRQNPNILKIAIASDFIPCRSNANCCYNFFGPNGGATKDSLLTFDHKRDSFVFLANSSSELNVGFNAMKSLMPAEIKREKERALAQKAITLGSSIEEVLRGWEAARTSGSSVE